MSVSTPPLNQVISAMVDILDDYLPPPIPTLPNHGVSMVSLSPHSVGLGNYRGTERIGGFAAVELKGIRLDARVRFQLWAGGPVEADTAMMNLNAHLMEDRDTLWAAGFLRFKLEASLPAERLLAVRAWRKGVEYQVLYEYRYADTDGAESLIARIPVQSELDAPDAPSRETTTVTDEMIRWDNQSAPPLVVRGPVHVKGLSAITFIPGVIPSGSVSISRTFDGVTGFPIFFSSLPDFISAVTNPEIRHAEMVFASLSDFITAFSLSGSPVMLGDWNLDSLSDNYHARLLTLPSVIRLPSVADRLEITYQGPALNNVAVIYLRVQQ